MGFIFCNLFNDEMQSQNNTVNVKKMLLRTRLLSFNPSVTLLVNPIKHFTLVFERMYSVQALSSAWVWVEWVLITKSWNKIQHQNNRIWTCTKWYKSTKSMSTTSNIYYENTFEVIRYKFLSHKLKWSVPRFSETEWLVVTWWQFSQSDVSVFVYVHKFCL
jgi:hypothetical protein